MVAAGTTRRRDPARARGRAAGLLPRWSKAGDWITRSGQARVVPHAYRLAGGAIYSRFARPFFTGNNSVPPEVRAGDARKHLTPYSEVSGERSSAAPRPQGCQLHRFVVPDQRRHRLVMSPPHRTVSQTRSPCRARSRSPSPEWKVELAPTQVSLGAVIFEVRNTGTIPHAFEVEGRGLEKSTLQIQPGATATLKLRSARGQVRSLLPGGEGLPQDARDDESPERRQYKACLRYERQAGGRGEVRGRTRSWRWDTRWRWNTMSMSKARSMAAPR